MRDLVRLAVFAGFAGIGAYAAIAAWRGTAATARQATNAFIAYALLASFSAGLIQRDLWPFSTWPLVAGIHPADAQLPRMMVVDRSGREHDVDYRAWEPFIVDELLAWANNRMLTLPLTTRNQAAEFLLARVEERIARVREGGSPGVLHRPLGPLAAPAFLLHAGRWQGPSDVPAEPLIGLRLYRDYWKLDERLRTPSSGERRLLFDYRRP